MTDNKKRLFKKEYAHELFEIAKGDLESAINLSQNLKTGRPENVVFLVQQSIEKSIKSVLVHNQIPFPLVHDLGILVALLPDDKYPPNGFSLTELNPFASVRRYEEGQLPLSLEEIKSALVAGELVIKWAQKIINSN